MNHQDLYKLLVTVQKNVRCPQCGKSYDFPLIQIRGIVDSLIFLELNCSSHMPLLATVSLSKQSLSSNSNRSEVTSNDVIETYKFFKDFNGSFENLFENSINNNTNK